MYISQVYIENIRCFKSIRLSFEKPNVDRTVPYNWNMVVGDNSTGKSCSLRCIAIGLRDESSGIALMKELEGNFLRKSKKVKEGRFSEVKATIDKDLVAISKRKK